jgi:hypothetical protein
LKQLNCLEESVHTEYHHTVNKINPRRYLMKKESSIVNIGHAVRPMRMISRPRLKPPSQGHLSINNYPDNTKPPSQLQFKRTPQQTVTNPPANVTIDVSHNQSDDHNDREVTPGTGSKSVMKPLGFQLNFATKENEGGSGSVSESEVEQSRSGHSSDLPVL